MFKKYRFYIGLTLLVQSASFVVLFFLLYSKKKSLANTFLALSAIGGLGDFLADCTQGNQEEDRTYYLLNEVFEEIAANDPNIGFVSAVGLGANDDNIHFNSDALYTFGLRYFDAYEQMITNRA